MTKHCSNCGAGFTCGSYSPTQTCWCSELPKIKPTDNRGCLCPKCLAEKIEYLKAIKSPLLIDPV